MIPREWTTTTITSRTFKEQSSKFLLTNNVLVICSTLLTFKLINHYIELSAIEISYPFV